MQVTGVGAETMKAAYGVNRADWSYIPGGVSPGTNLITSRMHTEQVLDSIENIVRCKQVRIGSMQVTVIVAQMLGFP